MNTIILLFGNAVAYNVILPLFALLMKFKGLM